MATKVTSDFIYENIAKKLGAEKTKLLDRVIAAGMKIMFSKETHHLMLEQLQESQSMKDNLATGITKLMIMMYQQSNNTMPSDLIIPAGSVLMAKAVEYLNQTGSPVSDADFSGAMVEMSKLIMKSFGVTDEHMNPKQPAQQQKMPKGGLLQGA